MFNSTIKALLISLLLTGSGALLKVHAQQWNGSGNINNNIWRNGNVGIGLNNPARTLHIRGSQAILQIDRDTNSPGFGVTRYSPGFGQVWKSFIFYTLGTAPNNGSFIIGDWGTQVGGPNTPRFVIGNTGNIGLGEEPNPSYPLEINNTASTGIQYNGNSSAGSFAGTYMNGGLPFYGYKRNNSILAYHYVNSSDTWILYNDGSRLAIEDGGNVGIGTTAPAHKLHVFGDARINGHVGIGTAPIGGSGLRVGNTDGQDSRITFGSAEYFQDIGTVSIEVNGKLISAVNGLDDIGTSGKPWRNLYLTGSVITSSDKRLKEDIHQLESPLEKVLQLQPVSYTLKNAKDKRPQVGLIAQEVQKVIPEIVYDPTEDMIRNEEGGFEPASTDKDAMLGIKYIELIPYLVAALQEQENTIFELKNELTEVKAQASLDRNSLDNDQLQAAKLYQNQPNPFDQVTIVRAFLPEEVQSATLYIYDMQGIELKRMTVKERGDTEITIESHALKAGMYLYTLIADNKEVGTNRMIMR